MDWRPEDEPRLTHDELEHELGHVVARGRRRRARRTAALGATLTLVAVLAATVVVRAGTDGAPDEVRTADRSTTSTTDADSPFPSTPTTPTTDVSAPSVPPLPRHLVAARQIEGRDDAASEIVLVDPATGKDVRTIHRSSAVVVDLTLSPDGRFVYFVTESCGFGPVERVRVDGPADQRAETLTDVASTSPAVSPEGRLLAYFGYGECGDSEEDTPPGWVVRVRDLEENSEAMVARDVPGWSLGSLAWSPDGSTLAVSVQRWDGLESEPMPGREEAFVALLDPTRQQDILKAPRVPAPRKDYGYVSPSYLPDGTLFVVEAPVGAGAGGRSARMVVVDVRTGAVLRQVATGDPKRSYGDTDADATGTHLLYLSRSDPSMGGDLRVSSAGSRTRVLASGILAAEW